MNFHSVIFQVFRSCWDNFYQWKQMHDTDSLSSLLRCPVETNASPLIQGPEQIDMPGPIKSNFIITEYVSDGGSCENYTISSEAFEVERTKPHPEYTECMPTTRNIMVGDDSDHMPFIPYSDDASFNHHLQTLHYSHFAWQEYGDPDLEAICTRAIMELVNEYELTIQQIIDSNIMPSHITRNIVSYLGGRRREYPKWPSEHPLHPSNVPYAPHYVNARPSRILDDLLRYFCANRNCSHGYCGIHTGELPLPPPVQPTLSNEVLYLSIEEACGKDCFVLGHHSNALPYWSDDDLDILNITLKAAPDTSPCDLATIVGKPCYEVGIRRRRWLDSQPPIPSVQHKASNRKVAGPNKPEFKDFDSELFTPTYPCSHVGPCTPDSGCPCALINSHCIGACKCTPKICALKWRGCTCVKSRSNKTCGTDRCPCFRAHRECDPDLCLKCYARDSVMDVCKNSAIQHLKHKRNVIRRSQWGLGYYLAESAREGDLITEYVGDLIYDPTTKSRDPVAAHLNRQYMFKLNPTLSVDGMVVGNESRYINHAPADRANVRAYVRLVNGEHRIGIFAAKDIDPGTELFLDYGSEFFHSHPQPQSTHEDNSQSEQVLQVLSLSFYQPKPPKSNKIHKRKEKTAGERVEDVGSDYNESGSGSGGN